MSDTRRDERSEERSCIDSVVRNFIPVRQTGSDNCIQCVVASIFGLSLESVPNFYRVGNRGWYDALQKWMAERDWVVTIADIDETPHVLEKEDDLYMGNWETERAAHAVVMQRGKIVWNPSGAEVKRHLSNTVFQCPPF